MVSLFLLPYDYHSAVVFERSPLAGGFEFDRRCMFIVYLSISSVSTNNCAH